MTIRFHFPMSVLSIVCLCAGPAWSEQAVSPRDAKARYQSREALARQQFKAPHEVPKDPPASAEVLSRRGLGAARVVRRGGLSSVQVNVDKDGNNILSDAANEPSIAIDPTNPDRMVIAWRQFDTIESDFREAGIAYSHDRGQTWTATTLDQGVFRSDPVLGSDSAGRFFFSSLKGDVQALKFSVDLFTSADGGVTWSAPVNAFGGDKEWLAVDQSGGIGEGNLYLAWNFQFSCCGPTDFSRSINSGLSFQDPLAILAPKMKWGMLAVGVDGTLYLAGAATDTFLGHVFARSANAQNRLEKPQFDLVQGIDLGGFTVAGFGINGIGLLGQVGIAADHSHGPTRGNIYVLGSVFSFQSPNFGDVHLIRSSDGGRSWSPPVRVNDDATSGAWHWFGTGSVAPNGRIDVIWNDTRNDPMNLQTEVFYSYSFDGGRTWSPNTAVTPPFDPTLGYPQNNKLGDYYHVLSDNGGASLAFAATFAGEQNVYFLRIPADCNGNGVEDPIDVAGGAPDCNGNQIPDTCEPNADCNANKQQDICDIAAGTSGDCNRNQIPDDCEPNDDCNGNEQRDICEFVNGTSRDCNGNNVPDSCDISSATSTDVNGDGIPDECFGACCTCQGCLDTTPAHCRAIEGEFTEMGLTCATVLCPPLPAANNQCSLAVSLPSVGEQTVPLDNRCATLDGPFFMPCEANTVMASDLWYTLESPCPGNLTATLCNAATFDTVLAVYGSGSACTCPLDNNALRTCGDDTCGFGGGPSIVTLPVDEGGCYTLRVGGWAGATGFGELTVSIECAECREHHQCDDANPCTTDRCDEATGMCAHINNQKPCNDGLYCTKYDSCSEGLCVGAPRRCPNGSVCDENADRCVTEGP